MDHVIEDFSFHGFGIDSRTGDGLIIDLLNDLNDRNILILKASLDDPNTFVKSIYTRYKQLSPSFGEEPFSYVHYYNNLSYLQSVGLIVLVATKVTRSYTNRVGPNVFMNILFSPVNHTLFPLQVLVSHFSAFASPRQFFLTVWPHW